MFDYFAFCFIFKFSELNNLLLQLLNFSTTKGTVYISGAAGKVTSYSF